MRKTKPLAIIEKCSGHLADPFEHSMRDFCSTCAPYWINIKLCGHCKHKIKNCSTGYCAKCKKYSQMKGV